MTANRPRTISVIEAADILGVSKMTTYRLIHDGSLLAYRVGHGIRVDSAGVERYLREARIVPNWGQS